MMARSVSPPLFTGRSERDGKGRHPITPINSATQFIEDTLYLDPAGVIDDPVLRRMADCIRELRPAVDRAIGRHGHGTTLMALTAIVANEAIDAGSGMLIAEAFRDNAEMLEAHGTVDAVAGYA
jgi:hypothetical protein